MVLQKKLYVILDIVFIIFWSFLQSIHIDGSIVHCILYNTICQCNIITNISFVYYYTLYKLLNYNLDKSMK